MDFDKPPERRPWDHAIDLTADFKPIRAKHYQLSQPEREALHDFLTEDLRTGRIRPSISPMASPFFFIKKEIRENSILSKIIEKSMTQPSRINIHSLLLISELIDRVTDVSSLLKNVRTMGQATIYA